MMMIVILKWKIQFFRDQVMILTYKQKMKLKIQVKINYILVENIDLSTYTVRQINS